MDAATGQQNKGFHEMTSPITHQTQVQVNPQVVYPAPIQSLETYPSNYKCLAWTGYACCSCPLGCAAVLASNHVDMALTMRNYEAAEIHSKRTKCLSITAIILGCIFSFLVFGLPIILLLGATSRSNSY
ncbi:uncharacterized protein [Clytia hemisphaerica]|uniref:Uncharacterized protein n=1 Tax=Clytia hemisphaerica TaxID=252671 RepID=A0A7M5XMC9_9CNID